MYDLFFIACVGRLGFETWQTMIDYATFWHGFSNFSFQQYLKLKILNEIQIRLQKDFTPIHVVALFNTKLGSEPASSLNKW